MWLLNLLLILLVLGLGYDDYQQRQELKQAQQQAEVTKAEVVVLKTMQPEVQKRALENKTPDWFSKKVSEGSAIGQSRAKQGK